MTLLACCYVMCSDQHLESDPYVLSIATHMATSARAPPHQPSTRDQSAASGATSDPSDAHKSGALHPEVQRWQVEWDDLQLQRLIGKGSFGKVRAAEGMHADLLMGSLVCVRQCLKLTVTPHPETGLPRSVERNACGSQSSS
jgi:hypothetical protein